MNTILNSAALPPKRRMLTLAILSFALVSVIAARQTFASESPLNHPVKLLQNMFKFMNDSVQQQSVHATAAEDLRLTDEKLKFLTTARLALSSASEEQQPTVGYL